MILSDVEIKEALRTEKIQITPPPEENQYTTSALDLRLGYELFELTTNEELNGREPKGAHRPLFINLVEVDTQELFQKYAKPMPASPDGSFRLEPNKFVLGSTLEEISLHPKSKIAARVEGRSSLARLGLSVHFTAPTIHCCFSGSIVLEMYNFGLYPLILTPKKLPICQLIFERVGRVPKGAIKTKYQHQRNIKK